MAWLQQHAWWGLFAMAAVSVVRGLVDLANGVTYQAEDLTGKTIAQIAKESEAGSRLSDFSVRTDGLHLIVIGVLVGAILLFAFRQDRPWAWWAMWTFPTMAIAGSLLGVAFGVPGQAPPGPSITGAIVGVLAAAILLISAPRFFKRPGSTSP